MYLFSKIPYCTIDDVGSQSDMAAESPWLVLQAHSPINTKRYERATMIPRGSEGVHIQFLLLIPPKDISRLALQSLHPPDMNLRTTPSNSASILRAVAYASVDAEYRYSSSLWPKNEGSEKVASLQVMLHLQNRTHIFELSIHL